MKIYVYLSKRYNLLLTAKVLTEDLAQSDQLGIAGAIAKPFDPLTLVQQVAVAAVLGWNS
jgi:CheY-like chemotaxis protein